MHVLRFGQSILCNPTGLKHNRLCAVAFPSRKLLQSIKSILDHEFRISSISTDMLLDHVDQLCGVDGIFELIDCHCELQDRITYYKVRQLESDVDVVRISERTIEFDNPV